MVGVLDCAPDVEGSPRHNCRGCCSAARANPAAPAGFSCPGSRPSVPVLTIGAGARWWETVRGAVAQWEAGTTTARVSQASAAALEALDVRSALRSVRR